MNEQSERRINQLTTTLLDVLAVLLLAAGACWALWTSVGPGAGLAVAGLIIFTFSQIAQRQATLRPGKAEDRESKPLPGPGDPGNLHVMGR